MLEILFYAAATGTFSFAWINKLSKSQTPVIGWLINRLQWLNYWIKSKLKKGIIVIAVDKLTFLMTECELCFAAQLALWTGVFYHGYNVIETIYFIGLSMVAATICLPLKKYL